MTTSSFQPSDHRGKDSIFEEDAALIAQLLEEDDSYSKARQVQDAGFDGQTYGNPSDLDHDTRVLTEEQVKLMFQMWFRN